MSSSLVYKPFIKKGIYVPGVKIKHILHKFYGLPCKLDYSDIEFLRGLSAANIEGADDLIYAIREYEIIELFESF